MDMLEKIQAELTQDAANDRLIMDKMDCGCVSNCKEMTESTATTQKQRVDELEGVVNPMMTDMCQAGEGGDDMPGGMVGVYR